MRGLNLNRRTPLAQRACEAAQGRTISLEQARACSHLEKFELGGNRFQIFRSGGCDNAELAALIISHLGSAFKDWSIGIYFSQGTVKTYVLLKASPFKTDFSPSLYDPAAKSTEVFNLNFNIHEGRMELSRLTSRILGKGGAALIALYNVAKGSGTRTIKYCVHDHNLHAKRFYAQMDFGAPTNPQWTKWEAKVES